VADRAAPRDRHDRAARGGLRDDVRGVGLEGLARLGTQGGEQFVFGARRQRRRGEAAYGCVRGVRWSDGSGGGQSGDYFGRRV
jgi:hypothetical protein